MAVEEVKKEAWYSQSLSIVVIGASGDLAKKKTYPALFELFLNGLLGQHTIICGYARSEGDDKWLHDKLRPFLTEMSQDEGQIDKFLSLCVYRSGKKVAYQSAETISKVLAELKEKHGSGAGDVDNRVFYLAVGPLIFHDICKAINTGGRSAKGFTRVILEKPFGTDTASAEDLGAKIGALFTEDHLYRIDHYLGKEMVQNLLTLRFNNIFLEPIWNAKYVKAVLVDFKEDIGTMGRGGYFDTSGIIRDIMQNHLMQVLSIVAMEAPKSSQGDAFASNAVRDAKVAVLKQISRWTTSDTVTGQYVGNGTEPGYLEDDSLKNKESNTPTFACTVMKINTPRWKGVPFIMRAGKALDERKAEVRIQLKPAAAAMVGQKEKLPPNEIVIRIQPNPAVFMKTNIKSPGFQSKLVQTELDMTYSSQFPSLPSPAAYTRLILDVLRGRQASFVRNDELLTAWKIATPLLKAIETVKPAAYTFGTTGPKEASALMKKHGFVLGEEDTESNKENVLEVGALYKQA